MQTTAPKKASISVKHNDTEIAIQSDNSIGDLAFFTIIMGAFVLGVWIIWGRKNDKKYYPNHTNKDNR